jgi:hypothetical protein
MYAGAGIVVNAYDDKHGVILESLDKWAPQVVAIRHIADTSTPAESQRT